MHVSYFRKIELLTGDINAKRPSIIVEKCEDVDQTDENDDNDDNICMYNDDMTPSSRSRSVKMPRTPRPEYFGIS